MVTVPIGVTESGEGFAKFPDGTLIQWGRADILENEQSVRVSFPVPFISSPSFSVTASWVFENTVYVTIGSLGTGGVDIYIKGVTFGITKTRSCKWQAIGRWK